MSSLVRIFSMRKTQALTNGLSHLVLKKKLFRNRNNLVSSSSGAAQDGIQGFQMHSAGRFSIAWKGWSRGGGGDRSIGKAVAPTDGHQALLSVGWFISTPWVWPCESFTPVHMYLLHEKKNDLPGGELWANESAHLVDNNG